MHRGKLYPLYLTVIKLKCTLNVFLLWLHPRFGARPPSQGQSRAASG